MRQSLVPVLLLTTVALSSSQILPMISKNLQDLETLGIDGQQNDNIFSNRLTKNIFSKIFFKVPNAFESNPLTKKLLKHIHTNNNRADEYIHGIDNYDYEGFRKEQWHNYPRQLDRLHNTIYSYKSDLKKKFDPDEQDNIRNYNNARESTDKSIDGKAINEFLLDRNNIAAPNPFLILKIRLACLSNGIDDKKLTEYNDLNSYQAELNTDVLDKGEEEKVFSSEENPVTKVKREGAHIDNLSSGDYLDSTKKTVNKRIFSLWSRLQTLSHKGHELPMHRRHLHSLYNLSNVDGNGVLTAETRATYARPAGSPLRWG